MTQEYKAGQVWARDGKQREIVRITDLNDAPLECVSDNLNGTDGGVYNVYWKTPGGKTRKQPMWCSGWIDWARYAKQVT